ncbi:MAG: hypothetical protein ACREF6_06465, partial [Alphaproteobacteria bacterium]
RQLLPIVAAAAALLGLAACETANQDAESITWNTPRQSTAQPQPPVTPQATPQPAPQATAPAGPECREFQTTVTIGGKPEKAYGQSCRQPDGTWKQVGNLDTSPPAATSGVEQSYPYGWYGYEYPDGPRYGPGYSVGVGVGAGSHGGGGFMGYGVGF